jgi:hypothetical protein
MATEAKQIPSVPASLILAIFLRANPFCVHSRTLALLLSTDASCQMNQLLAHKH